MNRIALSLLFLAFSVIDIFATGAWSRPPQGLDHYLDRLPGKSLAQLTREKSGEGEDPLSGSISVDGAELRLQWLFQLMGKSSRDESIKTCDDLLVALRQSPLVPPAWSNLVIDVRDCLADQKTPLDEAREYCRWRYQLGRIQGKLKESQRAELDVRLAANRGRTMAHYLYLLAADGYFSGDEKSSHGQEYFAAVVEKYPEHPRAETALFMIGRSALQSAKGAWGEDPSEEGLKIAESVFQSYLKHYPQGRFVGDVQGWLGAVAVKRGKYAEALDWYFRQMEVNGHPENVRSATQMVERVLALLLARPDQQALQEIAARPAVAMGTVYWVLHAPEANLYNGFYDHPQVVNAWRSHWLPRLAAAVQSQQKRWEDHEAMPWFVAIQAHALSDAGDQAKALELVDSRQEWLRTSDDLAFIRAVILQRSGAAPEAIAAYREYLSDFPSSALSKGATFRLATAYQDAGRSGDAVMVLLPLINRNEPGNEPARQQQGYYEMEFYPFNYAALPPAASALSPDLSVAEDTQVRQYVDTLLQFGPLEELVQLESFQAAISPIQWKKIRSYLLGRALSEGHPGYVGKLTARKDTDLATQIATRVKAVAEAPSAKAYLDLGNAWQKARGKLTSLGLGEDREQIYLEFYNETPENLRVANARVIGFAEGAKQRILRMDELWNAVQAWEECAKIAERGSAEQAQSLASLLEALPKIAMATPFFRRYAAENGWNEWAAKRYQQLITDCAESVEARDAARPSFRAAANEENREEPKPANPAKASPFDQIAPAWKESLYGFQQKYLRHREFLYGSLIEPTEQERSSKQTHPGYQDLVNRLYAIDGGGALEPLVLQMNQLQKKSQKLYRNWNDACIHFAITDLADLVMQDRELAADVRARYFEIRRHAINVMVWNYGIDLKEIPGSKGRNISDVVIAELDAALADSRMKNVEDRLHCLRLFLVANRGISLPVKDRGAAERPGEKSIETRDYKFVEKAAKKFLDQYPDSDKREAVWLLYLRATYRARRPLWYSRGVSFPENPFIAASYIRKLQVNQLPWDAKPVEQAIKDYLKEYSQAKYMGEVLDLQAALAVREADWDNALSASLAILKNPQYRDLHSDSRLRLCNIFALLADKKDRAAVLKAVKSSPLARAYLGRYLDATDKKTWGMEPLYFHTAWLRDELGK